MRISHRFALSLAGVSLALVATPALATRTVIDGNGSLVLSGYCDLDGSGCTPVSLGYSVDFGSGPLTQVLIYGNGLVSFGPAVANNIGDTPASLAAYGVPVVSLGLNDSTTPSMTGSYPQYDANVFFQSGQLTIGTDQSITASFEICRSSDAGACEQTYKLVLNPTATGYLATGTYFAQPPIKLAGYSVPGVGTEETSVQQNGSYSFLIPASFGSASGMAAVPEPATWLMMLTGIGAAGAAVRRRRTIRSRLQAS